MSDELKDLIEKVSTPLNLILLIVQLLDRNPQKRLGSGDNDANELVSHPFFEGFDWDALIKKEIPADFIPEISADHQQFYDDLANGEKLIGDSSSLV